MVAWLALILSCIGGAAQVTTAYRHRGRVVVTASQGSQSDWDRGSFDLAIVKVRALNRPVGIETITIEPAHSPPANLQVSRVLPKEPPSHIQSGDWPGMWRWAHGYGGLGAEEMGEWWYHVFGSPEAFVEFRAVVKLTSGAVHRSDPFWLRPIPPGAI